MCRAQVRHSNGQRREGKYMQQTTRKKYGMAALLGLTLVMTAGTIQAQPDFSGAWTTYRGNGGPGAFSAPGGQISLTADAQKARDEFVMLTEGTNYGAGNACVG